MSTPRMAQSNPVTATHVTIVSQNLARSRILSFDHQGGDCCHERKTNAGRYSVNDILYRRELVFRDKHIIGAGNKRLQRYLDAPETLFDESELGFGRLFHTIR